VLRVPAAAESAAVAFPHDFDGFRAWYQAFPEGARPEAEVLFIRRAHNPKDRWSGQVAFPGGRHAFEELDLDCAIREVQEEVGLDLASGDGRFQLLGRLPDRIVHTAKPFVVASFVFLQLDTAPTELRLAEKEVADAFWASTTLLTGTNSRLAQLILNISTFQLPPKAQRLASLLQVHTLYFPCLYLREKGDPAFACWGLTLGIVSDLLRLVGLPSIGDRWGDELSPLRLSQTSTTPFLTDSRLLNSLLEIYYAGRQVRVSRWVVVFVLGSAAAAVCSLSIAARRRGSSRL
jgi:8-oxo-dGTP pyrophosphatase MutT (NUDIX family)